MAFELLTGGRFAIASQRAPYIRVWLLGVLLLCGAIYSIVSNAHLLEALKVTESSNLFSSVSVTESGHKVISGLSN